MWRRIAWPWGNMRSPLVTADGRVASCLKGLSVHCVGHLNTPIKDWVMVLVGWGKVWSQGSPRGSEGSGCGKHPCAPSRVSLSQSPPFLPSQGLALVNSCGMLTEMCMWVQLNNLNTEAPFLPEYSQKVAGSSKEGNGPRELKKNFFCKPLFAIPNTV